MKQLEEQLKQYGAMTVPDPQEEKLQQTIRASQAAYYESAKNQSASYFEFLFQQAGYIRKQWWILQAIILLLAWILLTMKNNYYIQRSMGVLGPAFVILMIPELWKNRTNNSIEIEGASFYSLRQIYAARMLLFAMADFLLLSLFGGIVSFSADIKAEEIWIQFFLPMTVTCCICFRTLYSKYLDSEWFAVFLSLFWMAVWVYILLQDAVYQAISLPVWIGVSGFSILYLVYIVQKGLKMCERHWEVGTLWN